MEALEPDDPRGIGSYRLLGRLGAGGMGRVYLGRSAGGRTVAVKLVHPHFALDREFRARFRREVEAARRVGGEWTAPVLDADPDAAQPWVATGYVAGPALADAVAEHGPLPVRSVRLLGRGLAQALTAVHAEGLVHRDVKPSNVLLTVEGPRLIDFGIVRATDGTASLTATGASVGSPGYMAPEQILGERVTGSADVFSLGATLAYAATGAAPFPGDSSAALLYKVVHEEPELGSLGGELRELVAACLAKDPAARPTPADIATTLSEGTGAGGGWLPTPVVEQIGQAAVALLHLESSPPAHAPEPGPSGPVAFSSPAVGVFGPPPEEGASAPGTALLQPSGPDPTRAESPRAVPPGYAAGAPQAPAAPPAPSGGAEQGRTVPAADAGWGPPAPHGTRSGPQPGTQPTQPLHPPFASAPSHPSGPYGDGVTAGAPRPGRRTSRTVAVAVTAAVAAAVLTVTGVLLLDRWPGQGGDAGDGPDASRSSSADDGADGSRAQPSPPGTGATTSPTAAAERAVTVPQAFIGTWAGDVEEPNAFSEHVLTVEFTGGKRNEEVARSTDHLALTTVDVKCHALGTLVSATDTSIRVRERVDPYHPSSPGQCLTSDVVWLFTLQDDGTLRYEPEGAAPGRRAGTLSRTDR
ncbi:protein kinase domain-containing protein [Streptomyces sp. bgisy154]|uniref:serine/threonine-protein kinase n=1 Tax=Streptomyces sp. bgisy154 TaxID=3413794 RepID=UPI003D751921